MSRAGKPRPYSQIFQPISRLGSAEWILWAGILLATSGSFRHKYRCFYVLSQTVSPRRNLELGTHAGSGTHAYLSATPTAEYIGFDLFYE